MQQNETRYAPIVMFVYNRADHFEQTYEALTKCPEAGQSDLFIFSDGSKNERGMLKVEEVRKALHRAAEDGLFHSVTVEESPVNKGLAKSVIEGVTKIISQYGKVIVVEDDCVASPYFLSYMNRCLDFFEADETIGAISGYTPVFPFPEDYREDIFLTYRSCSWGWATWKNRWEDVAWDLSDMDAFYRDPGLIRKLNSCGNDRFIRLYRQTKGNGSSWSVRFGAHLVQKNQMTVYPRCSYISNIGCDSSGVHSRSEDSETMRVDLSSAIALPSVHPVEYSEDIQKNMKKLYSGGFISDIKRSLATTAIVIKERLCKH